MGCCNHVKIARTHDKKSTVVLYPRPLPNTTTTPRSSKLAVVKDHEKFMFHCPREQGSSAEHGALPLGPPLRQVSRVQKPIALETKEVDDAFTFGWQCAASYFAEQESGLLLAERPKAGSKHVSISEQNSRSCDLLLLQ